MKSSLQLTAQLLNGGCRRADGKLTAGQLGVLATSADEPHIVWRLNVRDPFLPTRALGCRLAVKQAGP